jgi:hypothetical protein
MPESKTSIQIYIAKNVLEASLIRRTLTERGIPCLIPGEDFEAGSSPGFEENAIFVPVEKRDEAIKLLQKAWDFFEPVREESEGTDHETTDA